MAEREGTWATAPERPRRGEARCLSPPAGRVARFERRGGQAQVERAAGGRTAPHRHRPLHGSTSSASARRRHEPAHHRRGISRPDHPHRAGAGRPPEPGDAARGALQHHRAARSPAAAFSTCAPAAAPSASRRSAAARRTPPSSTTTPHPSPSSAATSRRSAPSNARRSCAATPRTHPTTWRAGASTSTSPFSTRPTTPAPPPPACAPRGCVLSFPPGAVSTSSTGAAPRFPRPRAGGSPTSGGSATRCSRPSNARRMAHETLRDLPRDLRPDHQRTPRPDPPLVRRLRPRRRRGRPQPPEGTALPSEGAPGHGSRGRRRHPGGRGRALRRTAHRLRQRSTIASRSCAACARFRTSSTSCRSP